MTPANIGIVFDDVSRFYGEVLGINHVNLTIPPGVTSLVGPNGSGKTTLMNLMTGLIQPTRGSVRVLGIPAGRPEEIFRRVGYCTQFDAFPKGMTGYEFLYGFLLVHGWARADAERGAVAALERVSLTETAHRKVAGYSKGMRQRIKLAQAMAHNPEVLILDEPLNGLDPMARAETIALFEQWGAEGRYVIVSSHILHEVDRISDQVILLSHGYVVAEGEISGVRSEVKDQPMQVLVRCPKPGLLASRLFQQDHVVEASIQEDGRSVMIRTLDADSLYLLLNRVVVEDGIELDGVSPADADVNSVYQYLIRPQGGAV